MAFLGNAAMLIWYDIAPQQIPEHDDWHTREHIPERIGIPGFRRAQRWVSDSGSPRYFIVYEVSDRAVLSSRPYLDRLNHPTPWTNKMMQYFRGMTRGFCTIERRRGTILGTAALSVRFGAAAGQSDRLLSWLADDVMRALAQSPGFASAFILKSEGAPEMTAEQRIRGRDAGVDWVLLATSYSMDEAKAFARFDLSAAGFEAHGAAPGAAFGVYQLACLADSLALTA